MDAMTPLPAGTVAFLFTDIEGSTRLCEEQPEAMREALSRHHAVFAHAPKALCATATLQRVLTTEPWSDETPLRVRMTSPPRRD